MSSISSSSLPVFGGFSHAINTNPCLNEGCSLIAGGSGLCGQAICIQQTRSNHLTHRLRLISNVDGSENWRLYVCLSALCLKTDAARIGKRVTRIIKCSTMSYGNPLTLRSKVKVTRHKIKSVSVFISRRNAILPLAAYVSYAGFTPPHKPC